MHYHYKEEFAGGQWRLKAKLACDCSIKEDHWDERP